MQSLEAAYEEGDVTPSLCDCLYKMVCTHNHSRSIKKAKITASAQRSSLPLLNNVPETPQTSSLLSHTNVLANLPILNLTDNSNSIHASQKAQHFCIHTKLLELYKEECLKDPNQQKIGLKRHTNLLDKLVARERLNTIILNLYPGPKGYSIMFPSCPRTDASIVDTAEMIESKMWPYEDIELLQYLDLEELPAFVVDLLEPKHSFLFYSGCIIAQVRDYRQIVPISKYNMHHVLLKPTHQSILADVERLTESWSPHDVAQLESEILRANYPMLCLDTKTTLLRRTSRVHHNRHILNTHRIKRTAMKYSQVTINQKKNLVSHTFRPGLELYEYMNRLRTRLKKTMPSSRVLRRLNEGLRPIPTTSWEPATIAPPSEPVDITAFTEYKSHCVDSADCQPQLIEQYILETDMHTKEQDRRRIYHMKLSILQWPVNDEYLGELYLDRDHKQGERNGVACRFSLGPHEQARRYIDQFKEIFTESGRKSVRTSHCIAQNPLQMQSQSSTQNTSHHAQLKPQLQSIQPMVYRTVSGTNSVMNGTLNILQQQATSASVPILQAQLQTNKHSQDVNSEIAYSMLATKLKNSMQQIPTGTAKQEHLQSQKASACHAEIINLLNSSPASNSNSDASAVVVNALNNSQLLGQQTVQAKLLGRKITVPANARVLNAANVISVNNNRTITDLPTLQNFQPQQITRTVVSGSNFLVTASKQAQQQAGRTAVNYTGKNTLSALLVGTPAADRPDIIGNTDTLTLEKLAGASSSSATSKKPTFIQSTPAQTAQAINVQGLNFASIQGLSGVQVQLPGFSQPISLNVSSTGGLQGQSFVVSVPVATTANNASGGATQSANNTSSHVGNAISVDNVGTSTVVLSSTSGTAQLVASGIKRTGITQGTVLTPSSSTPLQLMTSLQRPRQLHQHQMQQTRVQFQQQPIRQAPITIKMVTTGGGQSNAAITQNVVHQVQKQLQHQHVQLQLANQQQFQAAQQQSTQHLQLNKITRRPSQNVSDPP